MSIFTDPLIVCPLKDGKSWALISEFHYDVGEIDSGERITVEPGFVTDFASVPKLFWMFFPTWGRYGNAAVIHDWLYWSQPKLYPRKKADQIFLEGMECLNVPYLTRHTLYLAVRIWGGMAWNKNFWEKAAGQERSLKISHIHSAGIDKETLINRPNMFLAWWKSLHTDESSNKQA